MEKTMIAVRSARHAGAWCPIGASARWKWLAALGLVLVFLAPATAPFALAEVTCPKRGGTISHGDMAWSHLDPTAKRTPDGIIKYVYDSLIDITPDLKYRPGLAVSLPRKVSDRSYEFELRRGVKFHDGTDFNADAVKFAMDRLVSGKDLTAPSPYTGVWREWLDKVVVQGPYKVRIDLKKPWPDFYWNVASTFFIPSPTAAKKLGKDFGTRGIVGTGPFMMKKFRPKNRLEVVRNPNYYRKGEPCLDGVNSIQISSGSVRLLSLKRGELTNVFTFPESQLPLIEGTPDIKITEGKASTLTVLVVNTSRKHLSDRRVRQALQYAVDGQEIIAKVYRGRGEPIMGMLPPWHPGYRKFGDLSLIRQDRAKARRLLKEAGYGAGNPLKVDLQTFAAPAHVERSVVLQDQFKQVGIQTNVRNLKSGHVRDAMARGKFDLVLFQITGGPTLATYSWDLLSGKSGKNFSRYNKPGGAQNKKVERIASEAVAMLDLNAAADKLATIQRMVFEDAPYIYLNWRNHREAWNVKRVKNHAVSKLKNRQDWRLVWLDQ